MNAQNQPTPSEPIAPVDASLAALVPPSAGSRVTGEGPAASFTGRTPHKTAAVRAGMILGTGLLVAIGAAVAMGASPSPSASGGAQTPTVPGHGMDGGPGGFGPGFGPGGFGDGRGFGMVGPGRMEGHGFGQVSVTAISGSNVSLATDDGWKRTIAVTSATTITKGGAAATLADLKVGDTVRFAETRNSDGTYTITAIDVVLPQTAGTVTAVGSDTITITLRDGTSQTFRTTGSTAYHLERADGKRSDVVVGSAIVASGEKAADGTLTASSVWIRLPHVFGTVTATTSSTITMTRPDGTKVTIHVGSGTTIRVAGVDNATLSDVKTGMAIVVEGTQRADGSIEATEIGAGAAGLRGPGKGWGRDVWPGTGPNASTAPSASGGAEG